MTAPPGVLGIVVWVLLTMAALVTVGAAVGALLLRDQEDRLHLVTPVTSVSGPLIGSACVLTSGMTTSAAAVVLVVALLAVTAPVLQSAVAGAGDTRPDGDETS